MLFMNSKKLNNEIIKKEIWISIHVGIMCKVVAKAVGFSGLPAWNDHPSAALWLLEWKKPPVSHT